MKLLKISLFFLYFFALSNYALAEKAKLVLSPSKNTASQENGLKITVKDTDYNISQEEIGSWFKENNQLSYDPSYRTEIENVDFCKYNKSLICELVFEIKKEDHIKKIENRTIDGSLIEKYVAQFANKVDKDPQDAKFKIEDGKVSTFSLNEKGITLDQGKSVALLKDYLSKNKKLDSLSLPYKETEPDTSIDSIDNMGITNLIGEGRSNFRGSPKNRIFNIKVATDRFNGILIKPGEEFSFVKVLGEVDGDHGYLPELVIKKDKTEPEFGGGICQVSTTAFRAALNSGLEITARRNHAYPVQYYNPQGMDSTVYVPRPDLKFKNNTPSYILIQTKIEGTELIFDFYGTDDGRKTELIGPTVLEKNPDGSMKTTLTQKVADKNGNIILNDVFNSSYDSPSKYPHPSTTNDALTEKPKDWSVKEWDNYKKTHGM